MTQSQLDRAVAHATGDTLVTIRRVGFGVIDPNAMLEDLEACDRPPQIIDWDDLDCRRDFGFPD